MKAIAFVILALFSIANSADVIRNACSASGGPCNCAKTGVIDCEGKKLTTTRLVPLNEKTSELKLSKNLITSIKVGDILNGQNAFLKKLNLDNNVIEDIEEKSFQNMQILDTLDLRNNKLKTLKADVFLGLQNLEDLNLDHNLLQDLSQNSLFAPLTSLKYLSIDWTPVSSVSNETFIGLRNLIDLSMDHAELTNLPPDTFKPLTLLQTLSLRHNRLRVVPRELMNTPLLKHVDLSGNPIVTIASNSFRYNPHLIEIHLVNMFELKSVEDSGFYNLHNLRTLKIVNCSKFDYMDPTAFGSDEEYFKDFEIVDLSNNSLSTLDDDMLPWENISTVRLAKNPWNCDCRIRFLTKLRYISEDIPICRKPFYLKGRRITLLKENEMICLTLNPIRTARAFTLASMLILCIGIIATACYLWATRSKSGLKMRNFFYKPQLPKYAYRNLAMGDDSEDPTVVINDQTAVLPDEQAKSKNATRNGKTSNRDLASRLAASTVDDL